MIASILKPHQYSSPATTGLITWLDAADQSTITKDSSDRISQWNDKSGNTTHYEQTTNVNFRPLYLNNTVLFDGDDDFLEIIANNKYETNIQTTFIVCKPERITTSGANVLFRHAYSVSAILTGFFQQNNLTFHSRNQANQLRGSSLSYVNAEYEVGKRIAIFGEWNGNAETVNLKTNEFNVGILRTGANRSIAAHVRSRLGCTSGVTPGSFWKGEVYEVLFYNRVLNAEELRQNWNYLYQKWNILQ